MSLHDIDVFGILQTCGIGLAALIAFFGVLFICGLVERFVRTNFWAQELWDWIAAIVTIAVCAVIVIAAILYALWCCGAVTQWVFG